MRELCQSVCLLQGLGNKVVEGEGPAVEVGQLGWGFPCDHEDDSHRVYSPLGGLRLCHLDSCDAQRPHVHLQDNAVSHDRYLPENLVLFST